MIALSDHMRRRFLSADCADFADGFSTHRRFARCGRAVRLTENRSRRLPKTSPLSESPICEICEMCGPTHDAISGVGEGVFRVAAPSHELPNGPADIRHRDLQLPVGAADVRHRTLQLPSGALGMFIHVGEGDLVIFRHKMGDFSVMRASHGLRGRYGRAGRCPSGPASPFCPSKTTT